MTNDVSSIDTNLIRSRQADLVDREIFSNPITIIGAGAIGSFTALTLAKMGFHSIEVYDDDDVSVENISNQFYRYSDIGRNKANALAQMLFDFEGIDIVPFSIRWERGDMLNPYVIMAVDSMTVRKRIFEDIKGSSSVKGFVDGRMGGQQAEIYTINAKRRAEKAVYEQYLWAEEEASVLPCTQKAVMYNVLFIASMIANNLRLLMEDKPYPKVQLMDFENVVLNTVKHE